MSKRFDEHVEELKKQKKVGEVVEYIPQFNGIPRMVLFIAAAVASFVIGRVFPGRIVIMLLTNVFSMWMMVDAARVLADTQDACILITNKRIYGRAGKEINLFYRDIIQIHNTRKGIFIDAGDGHRSVLLRHLKDQDVVFQTIGKHLQ